MKQLKLTYKKVHNKFVYGKKENHAKKVEEFTQTVKDIPHNNIISIDETSVDTHIHKLYGRSPAGTKIHRTIRQDRKRFTIITAISNDKVIHYKIIKKSADAQKFKEFLEELEDKNVTNKYLLLDNASIHHSKIVKEYMLTTENKFIYNVPYSPEFNPVEMAFSKFKQCLRKKNNNNNDIQLIKNIKMAFNKITKTDLQNYYRHALTF